MKLGFDYGTQKIEFDVIYRKRKTLSIEIEAPNTITVIAPEHENQDRILETVKSKAKWITQKLFDIREMEYRKRQKEFVNGESFLYMGRNYSLQLKIDDSMKKPITRLFHGKFIITTSTKNQEVIKASLEEWYKQKALEKITERIEYYQSYFNQKPKSIKIKDQQKRWGSCNKNNELFFNWRCIMASAYVLDYIIVHEMCHMVHLNHSTDFWHLVGRVLPDYEKRKEWLKNYGIRMDL